MTLLMKIGQSTPVNGWVRRYKTGNHGLGTTNDMGTRSRCRKTRHWRGTQGSRCRNADSGTGGSCMTVHDVAPVVPTQGRRFHAYSAKHLDELTARAGLSTAERLAVRAVATVLPFRTNEYVVESLIDWSAAPADPIYRLVFPQADMLSPEDTGPIAAMLSRGAPEPEIQAAANAVRRRLNP